MMDKYKIMMDKDKLYRISISEEGRFKRKVAKLSIDDLKELKSYFDQAMPIAKKNKGVNLKIRLANYKYLTAYMADDQTINRLKLEKQKEEQKASLMEKLKQEIDIKMNHLATKYRAIQKVPARKIMTTRRNYSVTLGSSMSWREMKKIYDRGFIRDEPVTCEEILSPDSYKEISKFNLATGESLVIRNSQIIGTIFDEKTMMTIINNFVSELVEVAEKYNLSDQEIDNYMVTGGHLQ